MVRNINSWIILEIIFNQAAQGNVYTSTQFCQAFESQAGLGGKDAIRNRIDVLSTKGFIQFFKDTKTYNLPQITRSKLGFMCVEEMALKVSDGEETKLISVKPTHYKCPKTGASLPVQSPDKWVYPMEDNNASK